MSTLTPTLPSPHASAGEQMGGNIVWEYGTFSLYATEILLAVIILLYIIGTVKYFASSKDVSWKTISENAKKNLKNPLISLPLALLIWSALSILWSYNRMLAWNRCIILMEGIIVYLFIIKFPPFLKGGFKFPPFLKEGFKIPPFLKGGLGGISPSAKLTQRENFTSILPPIEKSPCIPLWKRGNWLIPLLAGAIIQSILAIYQFISQQVVANKWLGIASHLPETLGTSVVETPLRRWLRAYGSLPHPNILAAYLGIGLLVWLGLKKQKQLGLNKLGLKTLPNILLIFLLLTAILLTFSRAVWIGLFLSVIIFLILNKLPRHPEAPKALKDPAAYSTTPHQSLAPRDSSSRKAELRMTLKNLPLIPAVGFFILFLFTLFLAREPIIARIAGNNRLEKKSNQEHILSCKEGADIIKEHWILGVGIGNYTYAEYKKNPNLPVYAYQPVHNLFMLLWAELGLIGLFIFIIFLFFIIKQHGLKTMLNISLVTFLMVIMLFDHYFWSLYFGVILFWLTMGILTI